MVDLLGMGSRIEVYGDESFRRGKYAVLGGIWLTTGEAKRIRAEVNQIRKIYGWSDNRGELKWRKCSGARPHPAYTDIIDLVMSSLKAGRVECRALVIENAVLRHINWNGGKPAGGILRAWDQLLKQSLVANVPHDICLDILPQVEVGSVLDPCVSGRHYSSWPSVQICPPYSQVRFDDSKSDDILQLADLLIGAVGFHAGGGDRQPGASPGKIALARRIAYYLDRADLSLPCAQPPFCITRITRIYPNSGRASATMLWIEIERGVGKSDVRLVCPNMSDLVAA